MADIFISYAREDEAKAEAIKKGLRGENWTVWSDKQIAIGISWAEQIEHELTAARCVLVLWSRHSERIWFCSRGGQAGNQGKRNRGIGSVG